MVVVTCLFLKYSTVLFTQFICYNIACVCSVASVMPDSVQPYGIVACQAPLPTGFSKARIMGWVNIPSSREFTQPIDQARGISCIFCIAGRFFYSWATQEAPILKLTYPLILLKASFLFPSWILSVPILLKKKKKKKKKKNFLSLDWVC